jgi:hypothetical protein
MDGVAAKSSLQRSSPQNIGSKGLTGDFWHFSPFLYRNAIRGDEELRILPLDFLSAFPRFFLDIFLEEPRRIGPQMGGAGWFPRWSLLLRLCAGGGEWSASKQVSG